MKKLLVLGITGKVGTSILNEFQNDFHVNGISRKDFDIIKAHKKCLKNDPYHLVYEAMEKAMKAEGQI